MVLQVLIELQWSPLIWRAAVPCSRDQQKPQHWKDTFSRADKASIDERGVEGPDTLQVLIEPSMVTIDPGMQSLAAGTNKTTTLDG